MTKKQNNAKNMDDLPDMIDQILPIWQKEIDRLHQAEQLTATDIRSSIQLANAMMNSYLQYRVLKMETRKDMSVLPSERLQQILYPPKVLES